MSNIILFNFQGDSIRVVTIIDEPMFVAKDVAELLGYERTRSAIPQPQPLRLIIRSIVSQPLFIHLILIIYRDIGSITTNLFIRTSLIT